MPAAELSLDELGIRTGTDKSRLSHDYLRHYERMMARFRNEAITLIEIGIHKGASLSLWEAYFPHARIIGVDVDPKTSRFARERVTVEIGSQFDADFLRQICAKYSPDIVIDDGSHIDAHQVFTFRHLFQALKPGGLYIVEDVAYAPPMNSAIEFFLGLQRRLILGKWAPKEETPDAFDIADVAEIQIITRAAAIWKRQQDRLDRDFPALEALARQCENPESLLYLARYVSASGEAPQHALALFREVRALLPENPWICFGI